MISARQLVRDLRPSSASSALFSLPGDDVLPSRHSQPYRASAQPQGMHPRTRHTAREWCSGYPGPGVPGARLRASGTGVGSGRLPSRWFRLGPLLRRSPAQPASPPDHPTPAQSSSASLPDGNASPTAKRQRYSASERPQGKRTPPPAPWTHQTPALPPNASLPVVRQSNRQTPALQRKRTTARQANPAPGPWTHQTPALPPSAGLPAIRQPSRRTPAFPPNACPTAERQRYSASI